MAEKFIPYEKRSKKLKREADQAKRGSWHGVNPVTRVPPNPKAYDRKKARRVPDIDMRRDYDNELE